MTAIDFPRPHGVVAAERQRAFIVHLDDPTYTEAQGIMWGAPIGGMTLAQLIETAADAQSAFHEALDAKNAGEARRAWRAMRAALLGVSMRATQRIGGPFHA